jgi:phosphoserine phosphatase
MAARFLSVALDVDSTLCGIEGIDWLAKLRAADVADQVTRATDRAMSGEIPLEDLYGHRLTLVAPTRSELQQLSTAYSQALAPDAKREIERWRSAGVTVVLISGGLREAIIPMAKELGFVRDSVNALEVEFDEHDAFLRFDNASPLYTAQGKRTLLSKLNLPRPLLAVGDGMTDLAMKDVADAFAAFTGFVTRDAVVSGADYVVSSFPELSEIILGG